MNIIIFSLIFSLHVFAQETNCDETSQQILKIASDLSVPNCITEENIAAAKSNNTSKLCNDCKKLFESRNDVSLKTLTKQERQELFVEAALKEYKKSITNNLVDTLKLRSLRPTGSKFDSSTASCKLKTVKDLPKSCSESALKIITDKKLLGEIDKEIQNELASILTTDKDFSVQPTLLKRTQRACNIPEKDALYISTASTEEAFSPEIIKTLISMDTSKFRSTSSMFLNDKVADLYDGQISELFDYLSKHPLIGDEFKTPQTLITFLKEIPEPKDVTQLRKAIYNKRIGDSTDAKIASSCKESFEALTKSICPPDFENGNFELSPFANQTKILNNIIQPSEDKLASNDKLLQLNQDVLKLCEDNKNAKIKFNEFSQILNDKIPKRFKELSFNEFQSDKFTADIGNMSDNICSSKDKECTDNSILCKMIAKFKSVNDPKSLDFKLANSSNKEVNELLRSMIGDTSKIDVKTKAILIAQGIIPKDDGTMVKQPDIPERQPEFFAKEQPQQTNNQNTASTAKLAPATNYANASKGRNPASDNSSSDANYSNVASNKNAPSPDFSDLMNDQQELKGIQDEIKRRLLDLPAKQPANMNEARKITRDSFKARNQKLTPEMEDSFATRMMQQPDVVSQNNSTTTTIPNQENRASVSGGESANAKWRKGQDQAALMGMAGAQKVLGTDATNTATNDTKPKDLTKVAINLSEDPKVTLSDIFNKKIDQNDSETQLLKVLLRNKNNFLLQIKSMNFKIVFDEKNGFNLLLESGDKQEAARIRPQLEMFLKKLKV